MASVHARFLGVEREIGLLQVFHVSLYEAFTFDSMGGEQKQLAAQLKSIHLSAGVALCTGRKKNISAFLMMAADTWKMMSMARDNSCTKDPKREPHSVLTHRQALLKYLHMIK